MQNRIEDIRLASLRLLQNATLRAWLVISLDLVFVVVSSFVGSPAGAASDDSAAGRPLWQFGFGAGGGVTPHYPASDQSSLRFLASPTFRYRGRVLRSDDEGTRARLIKFDNAEIDLSGAASFPVGAGENEARRGMRQLDWIGEGGPRLNLRWKFQTREAKKPDQLRLTFPFRTVASSDGSYLAHRGFVFQPGISWERTLSAPTALNSEISVELGSSISFIDSTMGNYYFGVAPIDVTPTRPAYEAKTGILAVSTGLTFFVSPRDVENNGSAFFVGVRHSSTGFSANRESPLHRADTQISFYAGFNILWINSSARESTVDVETDPVAPVQPVPVRQ